MSGTLHPSAFCANFAKKKNIMKKIINPWIDLTDKGYNCFACAPSNP